MIASSHKKNTRQHLTRYIMNTKLILELILAAVAILFTQSKTRGRQNYLKSNIHHVFMLLVKRMVSWMT